MISPGIIRLRLWSPCWTSCRSRRRGPLPQPIPSSSIRRRWVSKLVDTAQQALADLGNLQGATIAVGGFGPCGVPETLLDALERNETATNLTLVALDVGTDHRGVGKLIKAGKDNNNAGLQAKTHILSSRSH